MARLALCTTSRVIERAKMEQLIRQRHPHVSRELPVQNRHTCDCRSNSLADLPGRLVN